MYRVESDMHVWCSVSITKYNHCSHEMLPATSGKDAISVDYTNWLIDQIPKCKVLGRETVTK